MEIFMYMCEDCGTCMFDKQDRGKSSYANYCAGCKQGSFFKKVVVKRSIFLGEEQKYMFILEEKKDGDTKG
jgi:hypothetical protein